MKFLSGIFIFLLIAGCDSNEPAPVSYDSVRAAMARFDSLKQEAAVSFPEVNLDTIGCDDLEDTAVIFALAKEAQENEFPMFDELNFFTVRGHFTSAEQEEMLIRIESHAGVSCGTCCNLLLLYSCEKNFHKIWSGFTGNFEKNDIRDLNNDGILEIESECGFTWSCTLGQRYSIFNFSGGKENILYESYSENYMNDACGDKMREPYRTGDTISYYFHDSLIDPDRDGIFEICRIRESNLFRGGKTEAEMEKRQKTVWDTTLIPLK